MALDPRLILGLDTQAPVRTSAALGLANDRLPALKLAMGLQELQNQQAYRQAQLDEQKQQTAIRGREYERATRKDELEDAQRKANLIIPYVYKMSADPTENGLNSVVQEIAAHPELGPEKAAAFAQTYRSRPVSEWTSVSRGAVAATPKGQEQFAQMTFAEPGKDTGQWSEPYQLGGATVQRNSKTGEIKTVVSRPPVTHISTGEGKLADVFEGFDENGIPIVTRKPQAAGQRVPPSGLSSFVKKAGGGAEGAAKPEIIIGQIDELSGMLEKDPRSVTGPAAPIIRGYEAARGVFQPETFTDVPATLASQKKEQILLQARQLFGAKGFDNVREQERFDKAIGMANSGVPAAMKVGLADLKKMIQETFKAETPQQPGTAAPKKRIRYNAQGEVIP